MDNNQNQGQPAAEPNTTNPSLEVQKCEKCKMELENGMCKGCQKPAAECSCPPAAQEGEGESAPPQPAV